MNDLIHEGFNRKNLCAYLMSGKYYKGYHPGGRMWCDSEDE